jgi:hypothetical protein
MQINKNTWHYKVWLWSYEAWGKNPPNRSPFDWDERKVANYTTNLCTYIQGTFWRIVGWLLASMVFLPCYYFIMTPIALCIGLRPMSPIRAFAGAGKDCAFKSYDGLRINDFELYPGYLVLPLLVLSLIIFGECILWRASFWAGLIINSLLGLLVLGVGGLFVVDVLDASNNQTWMLTKEWITAKKNGVCPLITFEDKNG